VEKQPSTKTKSEETTMTKKTKTATASNPTVDTELKSTRLELEELRELVSTQKEKIDSLTRQLEEANQVLERDLKTDLMRRIKGKSNYQDADLEDIPIEQLQQIDATLSMGKLAAPATYKSIRSGAASATGSRLTVGNLYGKSKKEILAMEGEF
jgi:predicted nuclease with TOPRIM domain